MAELAEEVKSRLPLSDPDFSAGLNKILAFSHYARFVVEREAHWIAQAWQHQRFQLSSRQSLDRLQTELDKSSSEAELMASLRRFRHRELFACLWRDIINRAPLPEILERLSTTASTCIEGAIQFAEKHLSGFGTPSCPIVVLGMGKLGGDELNFSSDIDLIFAYPENGQTSGPRKIDNEQYFAKLVRYVSHWLTSLTEDGFAYRVDLRLRPFGESGRLALSFSAMEHYYQNDGREWERYALIKARPVAGDLAEGQKLLSSLQPFVYRRYLDFGAFEALSDMKAMINSEVERRGHLQDIKLGRGGIREIEFIAQAFQLVRGGREVKLRTASLTTALSSIAELEILDATTVEQLFHAYRFLRILENRIQQIDDQQTHQLPEDQALQQRLAGVLGYEDWQQLQDELDGHRDNVRNCFDTLFQQPEQLPEQTSDDPLSTWKSIWQTPVEKLTDSVSDLAVADPAEFAEELVKFRQNPSLQHLSPKARQRLDRLMPGLLLEAAKDDHPAITLQRVLDIMTRISRRSAYLALLVSQPMVIQRLVYLVSKSSWVAQLIQRHPLLLDDLIAPHSAHRPLSKRELSQQAKTRLQQIDPTHTEDRLDILRQLQHSWWLALVQQQLEGKNSYRATAKGLSRVAETLLQQIFDQTWADMTAQFGLPQGSNPGFAIIAYGTLGGKEMSLRSDLDLVFLYQGTQPAGHTQGGKAIDNEVFYSRLVRRIMLEITTQTTAGRLYSIDNRLRPNGNSGLLVSSFDAFEKYQLEKAWTWELQALCRARFVAGHSHLARQFALLRSTVINQTRASEKLWADVVEMREKMRAELDRSDELRFDIKQGKGGLVDLEFISQFARLYYGRIDSRLRSLTGTRASLKRLITHCPELATSITSCIHAYDDYQRIRQSHALEEQPSVTNAADVADQRQTIMSFWKIFEQRFSK